MGSVGRKGRHVLQNPTDLSVSSSSAPYQPRGFDYHTSSFPHFQTEAIPISEHLDDWMDIFIHVSYCY